MGLWVSNQPRPLKIALVGGHGVGKSAIGNILLGQSIFDLVKYNSISIQSTPRSAKGTLIWQDKSQPIQVIDTPGYETYQKISWIQYLKPDLFVLIWDQRLSEIKGLLQPLKRVLTPSNLIFVINQHQRLSNLTDLQALIRTELQDFFNLPVNQIPIVCIGIGDYDELKQVLMR